MINMTVSYDVNDESYHNGDNDTDNMSNDNSNVII